MKELNVAAGLETFKINGVCEVAFCPTDPIFVEKLYNVFDSLDRKQEAYAAEIEKAQKREIFDIARRRDAELREMVNDVFGFDICSAVFGSVSVCALSDGLPLWANLMLAIMEEVDSGFEREQKLTNPRIEKYTAKYRKNRK